MGQTDINRVMEDVLIPIFKELFDCPNLRNLNTAERSNYPGIDLGDETARIAFQVTASSGSEKVKETLHKFVEYGLYETYDRLLIYILTEKQKSYSGRGFDDIIQNRFAFDKERDIWDYTDITRVMAGITDVHQAQKVLTLLEEHVGTGSVPPPVQSPGLHCETVYLNLLNLYFPDTLYLADLAIDRKEIIKSSYGSGVHIGYSSSQRDVVRAALGLLGLKFGVDWVVHENKIITFHDLGDIDIPLAKVVDEGTVTTMHPREFYDIDEDYMRVFNALLGRCLQQHLYHRGVQWQHEEKMFIFAGIEEKDKRTITWVGKRKSEREVFTRTKKTDKPDETRYCKHLAFRVQYRRFGSQWYVLLEPDWFFSYDGYKKSWYHAEKVQWLKRQENTTQVLHQAQAIAYFLREPQDANLFGKSQGFLSFGDFVTFNNAPALNDKDWLPHRERSQDVHKDQLSLEP